MYYVRTNIPEAAQVIEKKFKEVYLSLEDDNFAIIYSQDTPTYKKVIGTRMGLNIVADFELNSSETYTEHLYIEGTIHRPEIYALAQFANKVYEARKIGLNDIDYILANLEEIAEIMGIGY